MQQDKESEKRSIWSYTKNRVARQSSLMFLSFSLCLILYGCGLGTIEKQNPTWKDMHKALADFAMVIPQVGEPRYLYSVEGLKGNYKLVKLGGDEQMLQAWLKALDIPEDEVSACDAEDFHVFADDPPAWTLAEPFGEFSCGDSMIPSRVDGKEYP